MNITERNYNVSTLNNRIENEGATAQGRLSAAQFNTLVNAAIEAQDNIGLLDAAIPKDLGTRLQNAETKFTHKINASTAAKLAILDDSTKHTTTCSFLAVSGSGTNQTGRWVSGPVTLPYGKTLLMQGCTGGVDENFAIELQDADTLEWSFLDDEAYVTNEDFEESDWTVRFSVWDGQTSYMRGDVESPGTITYRIGTLMSRRVDALEDVIGDVNSILEEIIGNSNT